MEDEEVPDSSLAGRVTRGQVFSGTGERGPPRMVSGSTQSGLDRPKTGIRLVFYSTAEEISATLGG